MADPMINLLLLRDTLVLLATEQKKLYLMLSAKLNELAAVRESVRGLDPTFSDVFQERQQRSAQESDEVVAAQVRILDELLGKAARVIYYQ
jgi:hypothetical protein